MENYSGSIGFNEGDFTVSSSYVSKSKIMVLLVLLFFSVFLYWTNSFFKDNIVRQHSYLIETLKNENKRLKGINNRLENRWANLTSLPELRREAVKLGFHDPDQEHYWVIYEDGELGE